MPRKQQHLDDDTDDDRGPVRTLTQLINGDIPVLKTPAAKLRLSLKKKVIVVFKNLPAGDMGLCILLPASKAGQLIIETTNSIPPATVVGSLKAWQKSLLRKDERLTAAIKAWKKVQAAVDSRGRGGKGNKRSAEEAEAGSVQEMGAQRSRKRRRRGSQGEEEEEEGGGSQNEEEEEEELANASGEQEGDVSQDEEQEEGLVDASGSDLDSAVEAHFQQATFKAAYDILLLTSDTDVLNMTSKRLRKQVAAKLGTGRRIRKQDMWCAINKYAAEYLQTEEPEAEARTAAEPGGSSMGGAAADDGSAKAAAAPDPAAAAGRQQHTHSPPPLQRAGRAAAAGVAAGGSSMGGAAADDEPAKAVAAPEPAAAAGQQHTHGPPPPQRARRAAAAGVAAAICAAQDDDTPSGAQQPQYRANKQQKGSLPDGYTEQELTELQKQLRDAKTDTGRAAIVKTWSEQAGMRDAPVEDLVRAAKFAVALAQSSSKSSKFGRQANHLQIYMQNSDRFGKHFGPGSIK